MIAKKLAMFYSLTLEIHMDYKKFRSCNLDFLILRQFERILKLLCRSSWIFRCRIWSTFDFGFQKIPKWMSDSDYLQLFLTLYRKTTIMYLKVPLHLFCSQMCVHTLKFTNKNMENLSYKKALGFGWSLF